MFSMFGLEFLHAMLKDVLQPTLTSGLLGGEVHVASTAVPISSHWLRVSVNCYVEFLS